MPFSFPFSFFFFFLLGGRLPFPLNITGKGDFFFLRKSSIKFLYISVFCFHSSWIRWVIYVEGFPWENRYIVIKNKIHRKALCFFCLHVCRFLLSVPFTPIPCRNWKQSIGSWEEDRQVWKLEAFTFSCFHFISFCFLKACSKWSDKRNPLCKSCHFA